MLSLAGIKNSLDEVRAQYYPKNETEKKVYDALSSANWGASTTQLNEIANDSNDYTKYEIIVDVLWRSLDTDGRTWKQLFKSLTLIEYLVKNGAERFIESARDKLHVIRRLEDYNFYEGSVDKGTGIREKAKQVVEILNSNDIIRTEREKARALRNKFGGVSSNSYGGGGFDSGYGNRSGGSDYNTSDRRGSSYSDNSSYSDSYSNGGIDSNAKASKGKYGDSNPYDKSAAGLTNTGRYGGGAYDSDRPPRYGDDEPSTRSDSRVTANKSSYEEERGPSRSGVYKQDSEPVATTTKGAKLKVSIKKEKSVQPSVISPVTTASAVNLIEDDFLSSPPIVTAGSNAPISQSTAVSNSFDNFSTQPAPFDPFAPTTTSANAFGGGQPTAVSAPIAAFDPFFPTAPQTVPYQQQAQQSQLFQQQPNYQQPHQQYPQQQQQFYPQQSQAPNPFPVAPAPTPHYSTTQPQQAVFVSTHPPQAPPASSSEPDFGDFASAPATSKAKMDASSKWGDLGKLVDLGAIGKVEANKKDPAPNSSAATFSGLDGFSKNQQSMSSANRPIVGLAASAPINASLSNRGAAPAMGNAPMGTMGGMQMGGMNQPTMMGPPYPGMMGAPMGAPMPMGGGGMPMNHPGMGMGGGYPAGMMGAPLMGGGMPMTGGMHQPAMNMVGQQQQYPGMMMGSGYPPQQQQYQHQQQQYRPNAPGGW